MPQKNVVNKQLYKSEHHLQATCVRWFDFKYSAFKLRLFAIPNGGLRNKIIAGKLKKEGARSGVWDLFLSVPINGKGGLFIESKNGKNDLTENQKAFMYANLSGYSFAVIRSLDEFIEVIQNYLNGEEV